MKIKEIEKELRPREKLIKNGAKKLTDIELLAIILSIGNKNESVIDLSKRLIETYGIKRLFDMNYDELKKINGIKEAKASKLMAIFEITRRILENNEKIIILSKAKEVYNYIKNDYLFLNYEMLTIIFLNKACKVIFKKSYDANFVTKAEIPFRKIILDAINSGCYGIIMVHNHPSGNVMPSKSDIEATKILADSLRPLDIVLLDHVIISSDKYFSIGENKIFSLRK